MLVYPFERDELSDCIVELLFRFDTLEEQLPDGRYLQYDLKLGEEETYHITKENLYDFIAMLIGSSGSDKTPLPNTYDSSIPFENLEFSDFLYEEHSNGNASISGIVENHNNYAVDGYFYILFYKNNKLVHWEHYFKRICEKYNGIYRTPLPEITPHICRHTYCSNMAKSGMNPKTLQYLMGHSDIGITLNTYTHLEFEDVEAECRKMPKEK